MEPRKTDIFSFVQEKLRIDDVEPMYTAIMGASLPLRTRQQLCLAEGLADHLGLAARMAESKDFWKAAREYIAQSQRGGARRHFRGAVAKAALRDLERRFPDVADFFRALPGTYYEARDFITSLPQFGPFSAFKIADMAERTCGVRISFDGVKLRDFAKFPQRGAVLAAEYVKDTGGAESLYRRMLYYPWCRKAPPIYDRPLGPQEIETVFCNYGHSNWHPPGYEGAELRKLLAGYGPLADKLSRNLGKAALKK